MTTQERYYLHAVHVLFYQDLALLHRLLSRPEFKTAYSLWHASAADLQRAGMSAQTSERLLAYRRELNVYALWEQIEQNESRYDLKLVTSTDPDYPATLKHIPQPPRLLYCRGNTALLRESSLISIVGARKATQYGKQVVNDMVQELVRLRCTTVSGLAFGIDALAHETTLTHNGATIAVLGSSVLPTHIAPQRNARLAERIIEAGGLIISEYAPGSTTLARFFPERNRIIAGLSPATVVVEATEQSGSLITAQYARDCGRDVFAVPGSIYAPLSAGTNALINQGATPYLSCLSLVNALEYLQIQPTLAQAGTSLPTTYVVTLSPDEQTLLALFEQEALSIDQAIERSQLPTSQFLAGLTQLVYRGLLIDLGNNTFIKR